MARLRAIIRPVKREDTGPIAEMASPFVPVLMSINTKASTEIPTGQLGRVRGVHVALPAVGVEQGIRNKYPVARLLEHDDVSGTVRQDDAYSATREQLPPQGHRDTTFDGRQRGDEPGVPIQASDGVHEVGLTGLHRAGIQATRARPEGSCETTGGPAAVACFPPPKNPKPAPTVKVVAVE